MHQIAAIAVALKEAATPAFRVYAQQVLKNATALAEALMERGCKLVTNGTENHLMLVDTIKSFGKSGKDVQEALEAVGITLNKNAIADDPLPPFQASGVRLGTPGATTRGMREKEMEQIAAWIVAVCGPQPDLKRIAAEVTALCRRFPTPSGLVEREAAPRHTGAGIAARRPVAKARAKKGPVKNARRVSAPARRAKGPVTRRKPAARGRARLKAGR
jgi:glycine hydroxymethyltransferase